MLWGPLVVRMILEKISIQNLDTIIFLCQGTGDLTAALLLARTFENPHELPLALELVGATLQAVLTETAAAGRKRRYASPRPSLALPASPTVSARDGTNMRSETAHYHAPDHTGEGSTRRPSFEMKDCSAGAVAGDATTTTTEDNTTTTEGTGPAAPLQQESDSLSRSSSSSKPKRKNSLPRQILTVPPEIRLIQCKSAIESPFVIHRCERLPKFAVKVIVFDMDGTLTLPHQIDFVRLRNDLNVPKGQDMLDWIDAVREGAEKTRMIKMVEERELEAMREVQLQPDLVEVRSDARGAAAARFGGGMM